MVGGRHFGVLGVPLGAIVGVAAWFASLFVLSCVSLPFLFAMLITNAMLYAAPAMGVLYARGVDIQVIKSEDIALSRMMLFTLAGWGLALLPAGLYVAPRRPGCSHCGSE